MKKLTALVALALLAIAGTGYAVTCAQDNVPAATLLVPYFRVGGAGIVGTGASMGDIPNNSGTDTMVAVTNVSCQNIIIHVTVWNKYSVPVLDFNVPMTCYDVVYWSMRAILNGQLNVNPAFQKLDSGGQDPCGQTYHSDGTITYDPPTTYLRFANPDPTGDGIKAISVYADPAFGGAFRQSVWTSLDESYDISNWLTSGAKGAGVIDVDNVACNARTNTTGVGTTIAGDFSGYLTIDVANFCTQAFPDQDVYYLSDAIATLGWGVYPGPNILMGDVFYKDQTDSSVAGGAMGNISGDPAVHIEFDSRLVWGPYSSIGTTRAKTFYGRYYVAADADWFTANPFSFPGDGREPLGTHYAFRYLQTAAPTTLRTWITAWRSGTYPADAPWTKDLCRWWSARTGAVGLTDPPHSVNVRVYDNDENTITGGGGPSGGSPPGDLFIFLETQRLVVTPNSVVVPTSFPGGWINLQFGGNILKGIDPTEQAYVEVQHSGLGLSMSVGHSATLLDGTFVCRPIPRLIHDRAVVPAEILDLGLAVQTNGLSGQ